MKDLYSLPWQKDIEDFTFTQLAEIPKLAPAYKYTSTDSERLVKDNMRQQLAHFIVDKKIEENEQEFSKEFRLRLIVATPAEFYKLVHDEAERLVRQFHRMDIGVR